MDQIRRVSAVVLAGCCLLAGCARTGEREGAAAGSASTPAVGAPSVPTSEGGPAGPTTNDQRFRGGCTRADHIDTTAVTRAPQSRWMSVQGVRVPLSEAGPFSVDGYRQKCFAPSVAGAVAAAANIQLRQGVGNPSSQWAFVHNTSPSLSASEAAHNHPIGWMRLRGFRVDQVSEDGKKVVVFVGVEAKYRGELVHVGMASPVLWDGTDWKTDKKVADEMSENKTDGEAMTGAYVDWTWEGQ